MKPVFSGHAKKELESMSKDLKKIFKKHLKKIQQMPPRRHLKHGIPYHVENVTRQARMIYHYIEADTLYILHCFKNHKEYESWYKSYK